MTDLVVFSVQSNRYAIDIESVQRIIQSVELTNIPNAHEYIDGMMSYEENVLKVLSFRKLINISTYEKELSTLFVELKQAHSDWVDSLRESVEKGITFTKTLDPHACGLGKWIDSFTAYDDSVLEILNTLTEYHKQLHLTGGIVLETYARSPEEALQMFNTEILSIYEHTSKALAAFTSELDLVADSLQKLIIYDNNGSTFAIKVDTIEDIAHVEENDYKSSANENETNDFLDLEGVLDLKGVLVNVIKTVRLPH